VDKRGAVPTGAVLMSAARTAWFPVFDGILVELADTPDRVRVGAEAVDLVRDLERISGGAATLVSGRRIEDIDRLFAPLRSPAAGRTVQKYAA
jgi:trehalose 6-phosphate phosphatase